MAQLTRRGFVATAAAGLAGGIMAAPAWSQAAPWPSKPVKIIVPVAAGTATDLTARFFGERLSARWKQGVVIENKTGADGLIAIGTFVNSRDDHTLLFSFSTAVSLNPLVHAKLSYDPEADLVPITTTSEVLFVIAVHSGLRATSIAELNAEARANPGKLNWAAAPGLPRFVFERHRRAEKLDMAYVGYTQTGNAVQDLGEGRIQVMIASLGTALPVIEAGKARPLVVASTDRTGLLKQVPHAIEAGFPELAVPAIGCAYGWKGMPDALRARIAKDIDDAAQDPSLVAQLEKIGQIIRRSTPESVAALLRRQRKELEPLAALMSGQPH